jgi:hypothetical protein
VSTGAIAYAADASAFAADSAKTTKRARQMPFRGKIAAVDVSAKTITLSGRQKDRVFHVTESSRIKKDGKVFELEDVRVGETVGGLAVAAASGDWEILTLNIGPKPAQEKGGTAEAPAEE